MSLLMFRQSPDEVVAVTDTLATTPDGQPCLYVSKAVLVPHLDLLVACTGIARLGDGWRATLYSGLLSRDIETTDVHAPEILRGLWAPIAEQMDSGGSMTTTTIYHFGFSELHQEYRAYAYRSASDFESELLAPGFGVKPEPSSDDWLVPTTLEEMVELAGELRGQEDAKPVDDRIHIGGDLQVVAMARGQTTMARLHRFGDFEGMWEAMNSAL